MKKEHHFGLFVSKVVWAKSKQVGCAFKWCDKHFGQPHPWVPGETVVTCDYYPR